MRGVFLIFSILILSAQEIFATTTLRVTPSPVYTKLNGTFTIDVVVEDVTNLMAGNIRIAYDSTKIQGEAITEGTSFLTKNGGNAFFTQKDITNGSVSVVFAILGGTPVGVSGSGTLCSISFKTITGTPTSQIIFDLVDLRNTDTNPISIPNENQFPAQILPVTGSISISSNPNGASILLDGGPQGITPTTVGGLTPGTHTIKLTLPGYYDWLGTVTVTAGTTTPVLATLTLITGSISISSHPGGANIFVDGKTQGITPAILGGILPGTHTIKLTLPGYYDWLGTVTVTAGITTPVSATLTLITGSISISSHPGEANIFVDGKTQGITPATLGGIFPGTHTIKLTLPGYYDWLGTVTVTAGTTTPVLATLTLITGSISVSSNPVGANIFVDGKTQGITPATLGGILPGAHTIKLTLSGYYDWLGTVTVTAGITTPVLATLTLITGSISISSHPDRASIFVDGKTQGITPATLGGILPGTHTIKLTLPGYYDWLGTVTVTAGITTPVSATLTLITGSISISSHPSGANIFVDGKTQGITPATLGGLLPGAHTIRLTKQGYCDWFGTVTIPAVGSTTYLYATLTPSSELHHFKFSPISNQRINEPFNIQIFAENEINCVITDFYGTVTLNDTTRTIFPQVVSFIQGIGSAAVTINIPKLAVQIIAATGGITGISNSFDVLIAKDKPYYPPENNNIKIEIKPNSLVGDYILEIDQFSAHDNFEISLANDRFNQDPTICHIETSVHKFTAYNSTQTLNLTKNATTAITFSYTDTDLKQIDERKLKVYYLDTGHRQWIEVPCKVYPSINKVTAQIPQMGIYILAGAVIANNFNNFVVFPNPLKKSRDGPIIEFSGLPEDVTIRIYDISGNLVKYVENQTATWQWEAGKEVDSGIYIYIIEDKNSKQITGKIGVIR